MELETPTSLEWALWEDTHISIGTGGFSRDPRWNDDAFRIAFVRLTTHYWMHAGVSDPPILSRMERLHGIPGTLIHGRRDISSPMLTAWEIQRHWPDSVLMLDEGDGHGGKSMVQHWDQANAQLIAKHSS